MEKKDEYKELRVLFDSSLEDILVKELEKSKIIRYIIVPRLKVSWEEKVKHLNTHVWPGEDAILLVILEKDECYKLVDNFLKLKEKLDYKTTFNISVSPLEYVDL